MCEAKKEDIKKLYDIVVNSMDWGSGFLESEEVEAVRRVMEACGFEFQPNDNDECVNCNGKRSTHRINYKDSKKYCYHEGHSNIYDSNGFRVPMCKCTGFKARWDIEAMTNDNHAGR